MTEAPACLCCADTRNAVVYRDGDIRLRRCSDCGLVFSDPMTAVDPSYYQGHIVYAHKTVAQARAERIHLDTRRLDWMERLTQPGAKLLDIGCGSGAFVSYARDTGRDAYGIDFNDQEIDVGKTAFQLDGRLMSGDVLAMPDSWSEFNMITMFEVIEHLPNPGQVIQQVYSRLKKGGYLALSCPNENRWQPAGRIFVDYPPHHLTRWSPKCLQRFLESNCFEHVHTEVDASFRDIVWTAYVNRRARTKLLDSRGGDKESPDGGREPGSSNWKWKLDRVLRMACAPLDVILSTFHIGTMGMRMIVRKPVQS